MPQSKRKFSRSKRYGITHEYPCMYIFTEGEATEENYFRALCEELHLLSVRFKKDAVMIKGMGRSTSSLVKYAAENRESADEVWVVFDRDQNRDFDKAIEMAHKQDVHVAYSNECFELWFVLHFEYLTSANGRDHSKRLSTLLGKKYQKTDLGIYRSIKNKEAVAIKHAKKLEAMHAANGVVSPAKRDPSTTVYLLVERLRSLGKRNLSR